MAESACKEWIVRKKNVSEFLNVGFGVVDFVTDPFRATRFARQTDGALAVPHGSGHVEVIPFADALKFGRAKPNS